MHDDGSKDKHFKQLQTIAASALLRFYRQRHADAALFRLPTKFLIVVTI